MSSLGKNSILIGRSDRAVKPYVVPVAIWFLVLIFGWGVMRAFWEFSYKYSYDGMETLPYYLSANWGDALILPTVCAIGYVEIRTSWRSVSRVVACVSGLFGFAVGVLTQIQWNLDANTVRNWTFNRAGGFNLPGWYHAAFLIVMCGVLTCLVGVSVHVGCKRRNWERSSALRYMAVGYLLVLFSCLLATDNLRQVNGVLPLSTSGLVGLWSKPLLTCVLVVFFAHLCNLSYRGVVAYALTLATTALSIPLLFMYRGLEPVTLTAGIGCMLAFVFALSFITAPSSVSSVERLLRSLPTAVLAAVFVHVVLAKPEKVTLSEGAVVLASGLAILIASSTSTVLYDGDLWMVWSVARASVFSVCLIFVQVVAFKGGRYSAISVGLLFPFFVWCSFSWVKENFNVVIDNEKNAVGHDSLRYREWSIRVGMLGAYIAFVAFVYITASWLNLTNLEPHPKVIYRMLVCSVIVVAMTVGAFSFSRVSYVNNVFILRGVTVVPGLVYFGSVSSALASLVYGVVLFQYPSSRLHVGWWGLLSMLYVGVLWLTCVATLKFFDVPKAKDDWTFTGKVVHCVLQDHLLSLALMNILGLGLLVWISDRFVWSFNQFARSPDRPIEVATLFATLLGVMAPMAEVFEYYIGNNVGHLDREKLRISEILDKPECDLLDRRRGEEYLCALEKHLRRQNEIASVMVAVSVNFIFLYYVVKKRMGLTSGGSGRTRNIRW